jgi:hypothetical protein
VEQQVYAMMLGGEVASRRELLDQADVSCVAAGPPEPGPRLEHTIAWLIISLTVLAMCCDWRADGCRLQTRGSKWRWVQ